MPRRTLHVAVWILSRLVPEREREAVVGDLVEEYALRAKGARSSAALKWYLRQICASAPPLVSARLERAAWISTVGVALLAYIAVGVVETVVNWAVSSLSASGSPAYNPIGMLIAFPMVAVIGYFAARLRRRAAIVLAAMMLLAVTVMTLSAREIMPLWYRIAYFFVGPMAAFIGTAFRSIRPTR